MLLIALEPILLSGARTLEGDLEEEIPAIHRVVKVLGAHILQTTRVIIKAGHVCVVDSRVRRLDVVRAVGGGQRVQRERILALRPR